MNKKNLIIIAVIIILITLGAIMNRKPEEYTPKKIVFDDECSAEKTCEDTVRTCIYGIKTKCENGCVYGRCTKCIPICPEDPQCGNITCPDSIRSCPDGRVIRCANHCSPVTGKCTSCIPECDLIDTKDEVFYPMKSGEFILDAVPCVNATYTERIEKRGIQFIKKNITKINLPTGYSVIMDPFSVDVDGSLDMTLNIPENYIDVKALRCRGEECNRIRTRYVTELKCGERISQEFLRKEEYLEPKFTPIKITKTNLNLTKNQEIKDKRYKARFKGDFKKLDVTLSMPKKPVPEAKNPYLKITGTPLVIKIKDNVKGNINSTVTMPYISLGGFENNSVSMYIKIADGWDYTGGNIDKNKKTVTAHITNITGYLDENNEIQLALMGILCHSCYNSTLNKVYEPEKESKDAIILVHGFGSSASVYQGFIDDIRLTNQPFQVWSFEYPSEKPIKENAKKLADLIEKNHAYFNNVYIVAHSLGGLIAQQALHHSHTENKKSLKYYYMDKVRKVVLIGSPNEGSPVVEVYKNTVRYLINDKTGPPLFNLNSGVMSTLIKGIITPQVPDTDYYVIAGTKTYEFNLLFFRITTEKIAKLYEKNDGIITVKSAQHIGDEYINNQCEDYWELNLSHTELIKDPVVRKIVERIISENMSEKDTAILGHNKYFDLSVKDNLPTDNYVIIGKKIREELVIDETECKCGNGYCGEGEDEISCPSDCAIFLSDKRKNNLLSVLIIILIVSLICSEYINARRYKHPYLEWLLTHIKNKYEFVPGEGYTIWQIRSALLTNGWPKRTVNDVIRVLKKEFHNNYHKPLKKHIKKHLRKGLTEEEIKTNLINAGWKRHILEKVLKGEELEMGFKLKKKYTKPKLKEERHFFDIKNKSAEAGI